MFNHLTIISMEKIYCISNQDSRYPQEINRKIVDKYLNPSAWFRKRSVDIYADDDGKLYYSFICTERKSELFVPIMELEHNLYFEKFTPYLKHPNCLSSIRYASADFTSLEADIKKAMPASNEMFKVLSNNDYGRFEIKTERQLGVICNAFYAAEALAEQKCYPLARLVFSNRHDHWIEETCGFACPQKGALFY